MRHLVAAIDRGTIRAAADAVFISQPALTRSLKNLEHELGVELLQRLPRGVVATEAGELFYRRANLIIHEVDKMKADVPMASQGVVGNLKIGVGALFAEHIVDDVIWELASTNKNLSMAISFGFFEGLVERLIEGSLDVVFTNLPSAKVPDSLIIEPLSEFSIVFAAHRDHHLSKVENCSAKELEEARWVMVDRPHADDFFSQFCAAQGMNMPRNLIKSDSLGFIQSVLRKGGFVSALPKHLLDKSNDADNLVELNISGKELTGKFGLIYREDIAGRPALEPFCEGVREACARIRRGTF